MRNFLRLILTFSLMVGLANANESSSVEFSKSSWMISFENTSSPQLNLPKSHKLLRSNNNLDIHQHGDRLFFIFRTASHHHPKPAIFTSGSANRAITRMHLVSTQTSDYDFARFPEGFDQLKWQHHFELNKKITSYIEVEILTPDLQDVIRNDSPWKLDEAELEKVRFDRIKKLFGAEHHDLLRGELVEAIVKAYQPQKAEISILVDVLRAVKRSSNLRGYFLEYDLREPTIETIGDQMIVYVQIVRGKPNGFDSLRTIAIRLDGEGNLQSIQPILSPKEHYWESRVDENGKRWMTTYKGGHYSFDDRKSTCVSLKTSSDGIVWNSADPNGEACQYEGGANESTFAVGCDGSVSGIIRNDDGGVWSHMGSADGMGAVLFTSKSSEIWNWDVRSYHANSKQKISDPRRFDSPRMFTGPNCKKYLVARQWVPIHTPGFDHTDRRLLNLLLLVRPAKDKMTFGGDPLKVFLGVTSQGIFAIREALGCGLYGASFGNLGRCPKWWDKKIKEGDELRNHENHLYLYPDNRGKRNDLSSLASVQRQVKAIQDGAANKGLNGNSPLELEMGPAVWEELRRYFAMAPRTALYELNEQTQRWKLSQQLPSAGDTAFPRLVWLNRCEALVANYSSDPSKRTWSWGDGQVNRTGIYFQKMSFKNCAN